VKDMAIMVLYRCLY